MIEAIKKFWDSQAKLGDASGSQDIIGARLEAKAISSFLSPNTEVLDAGCGVGNTITFFNKEFDLDRSVGIDYSQDMIKVATIDQPLWAACPKFYARDVKADLSKFGKFDVVYTQRCLINLDSSDEQYIAACNLSKSVKPGGLLVLCENSRKGLMVINSLRKKLGLDAVSEPWHNCYFNEAEVRRWDLDGMEFSLVYDFSSAYYFLSRIVNAWNAKQEGNKPDYFSEINKLGLELPPYVIKGFGQTKIWVWKRRQE